MNTGSPSDSLYKLASSRSIPPPKYEQMTETGPPHLKLFVWQCRFMDLVAQGQGRSKKEAKHSASKAILEQLDFSTLPNKKPAHDKMHRKKRKDTEGDQNEIGEKKFKANDDFYASMLDNQQRTAGFLQNMENEIGMKAPMMPRGRPAPPFARSPMGRMPLRGHPGMIPPAPRPLFVRPAGPPVFGRLDKLLIQKHKDISPNDKRIRRIMKLVNLVESILKNIAQKDKKIPAKLLGVTRVGLLAKGLLLIFDSDFEIALVCEKPPTVSLIHLLKTKLDEVLNCETGAVTYSTEIRESEAAVFISQIVEGEDSYTLKLSLTCSALRSKEKSNDDDDVQENQESNGSDQKEDSNREKMESCVEEENKESCSQEDSTGPNVEEGSTDSGAKQETSKNSQLVEDDCEKLPTDKCVQTLARMRQTNWFMAQVPPVTSCAECIRIMRDICMRNTEWSSLNEWSLELLCHKILSSGPQDILVSPYSALNRIFQALASGILLPNGPGLLDPCEWDKVDALAYLTDQQREDITSSAQTILRMISFKKLHEILGMEKDQRDKDVTNKGESEKSEETQKSEEVEGAGS